MQPGYRSILHDAQKKLEAASKEMDDIKPLLQELSREIDLSLPAARPQKNDKNEIIHKESDRKNGPTSYVSNEQGVPDSGTSFLNK